MISEFIQLIKDHFQWRSQIIKLAGNDLRKSYSGSTLGWSWAIIRPSVFIFVLWFAFSVGLRVRLGPEGFSFFQWLIAGMVAWFYISDIWKEGAGSMRKYSYLITKMKFPVTTIPTFVSLSKLLVHIGLLLIVVVIFAFYGDYPSVYYIQLLFYMLLMFLMGTGWALFSATLASLSKDFLNLVKTFSTAIFWLSGIMWDPNSERIMNIEWLHTFLSFNPVTYIVSGYRDTLVYKVWFFEHPTKLLIFLVELVLVWALGIWVYTKAKRDLPDVL